MGAASTEVTSLLHAWGRGDGAAFEQLVERVYPELRRMARGYLQGERHATVLQATALVHEVYLRLVDVHQVDWRCRAQFFALAAQMMRRILVDAARARAARKRDGLKIQLDEAALPPLAPDRSLLALDAALTRFTALAPRQARAVELRYFGGLNQEEIASVLNVSPRTVRRDWDFSKAWLLRELRHGQEPPHERGRALSAD